MSAADWVARHLGRELSEFQRGAVDLICDAMRCGPYDFAGTFAKARWDHGRGVSFVILGQELATFDSDGLTRLVVGAHDRCYRVSVEACAPRTLRVSIWPRDGREGPMHKRHPTMEDAVRKARIPSHGLVQGAPELEPRELDRLKAERDALRDFAQRVIDETDDGGDVPGDAVEAAAEACGLLRKVEVSKPCGDGCACAEACAGFPTYCYRATDLLRPGAETPEEVR